MDDDESGLELSLGLGCAGSSTKSKGKTSSSSDTRPEDADKGNKVEDDIKNFFQVATQKQDSSSGSHRTDSLKPQENFFNDLSKADADTNASTHLNNRGLWDSKSNRSAEIDEERRSDTGNKRKMLFEEISNSKKHERDTKPADLQEKKTSYISITTDDGSTADNEDMAESEVEVSTQASHHGDGSKQFIGFGGPSNLRKEVHLYPESDTVDFPGQKRHNGSSGTEVMHGNTNYGVAFSVPPVNILNVPFPISVKESNSVGAPGTTGHPLISMMQVMPPSNGEQQKAARSLNPGNSPVTFGYPHVQLPTLDKNTSWVMGSHSQPLQHTYAGSSLPGSDKQSDSFKVSHVSMPGIQRHASETALYDLRKSEWARGDDKHQNKEEGTSSHPEDDATRSSMNLRPKDSSEPSTAEGFSIDFSAIKPGIAADVKFGGCGSYPNLPWVSTTAPGPNGRTISGVTYRYNANQIKIVCACHGSHMSPEEFVRHASEENANPENNGPATFPNNNPAASAQS